jgi:hypothetical protein
MIYIHLTLANLMSGSVSYRSVTDWLSVFLAIFVLINSIIYLVGNCNKYQMNRLSSSHIITITVCVEVIVIILFIQASESEWLEISEDDEEEDDDEADDNENGSEGDDSQTDEDEEVMHFF